MALTDNLLAYYKFDEASGNALDAHSVGPYDLSDNNTVGSGTGKLNNARDFDGSTEYFSRAGTTFRFPSGNFTVSCWIKADTLSGETGVWGSGVARSHSGDQTGDWNLSINNSGAVVWSHWKSSGTDSTGRHTTSTTPLSTGTWAHVVLRLSGGAYTIWVNGSSQGLAADATTSSGWGNVGFEVGRMYADGLYCWDGLIDELAIWDRAVTDGEIATLYGGGTPPAYPLSSGASSGSLSVTLDALTLSATGAVAISGTLSTTLAALTLTGTGTVALTGAASITLAALTLDGVGTVAISGSLSQTLDALTLTATGSTGGVQGSLAVTLDALTVTAAGTLAITGALSQTLGTLTLTGAGTLPIAGSLGVTLGSLTLVGVGVGPDISGSLTVTLDALTLVATGGETVVVAAPVIVCRVNFKRTHTTKIYFGGTS